MSLINKYFSGILLLGLMVLLLVPNVSFSYAEARYLSGGFIQLNELNAQKSAQWWYQKVDQMERIGIDTIVIQYSAFDNTSFVDIPSDYYDLSSGNNDPIEHILSRADYNGMDVYVGLGLETSFKASYNSATYQFEFNYDIGSIVTRAKKILKYLDSRYSYSEVSGAIHESLVGWYFPTEFNDANVIRSGHQTFKEDAVHYYSALSLFAHNKTGLSTMISPYIAADGAFYGDESRDPEAYAAWWDDVLDDNPNIPDDPFIDIDIIAHQDSVGAGHVSIQQAQEYFQYLKPVLKRNGVQLWANNEAFKVENDNYVAASFSRFKSQLLSTGHFVSKSIVFEFMRYMSQENNSLYDSYSSYCCE